eukprot:g35212.t1
MLLCWFRGSVVVWVPRLCRCGFRGYVVVLVPRLCCCVGSEALLLCGFRGYVDVGSEAMLLCWFRGYVVVLVPRPSDKKEHAEQDHRNQYHAQLAPSSFLEASFVRREKGAFFCKDHLIRGVTQHRSCALFLGTRHNILIKIHTIQLILDSPIEVINRRALDVEIRGLAVECVNGRFVNCSNT